MGAGLLGSAMQHADHISQPGRKCLDATWLDMGEDGALQHAHPPFGPQMFAHPTLHLWVPQRTSPYDSQGLASRVSLYTHFWEL